MNEKLIHHGYNMIMIQHDMSSLFLKLREFARFQGGRKLMTTLATLRSDPESMYASETWNFLVAEKLDREGGC